MSALLFKIAALFLVNSSVALSNPLPEGFTNFNGSDPSQNSADLKAIFDPLIGNAPVVAIGESVHGTAEYTRIQHRLLKYLIEEKGFRIFVLENPRLRSEAMTEALADCAKPLPMKHIYFPFEEDRALFQWVQSYNCTHPTDQVHFRGIDIWDRYWELHQRIVSDGKALGIPDMNAVAKTLRTKCMGHNLENWDQAIGMESVIALLGTIPPELYGPCMTALQGLVQSAENAYATATTNKEKAAWASYLQILNTAYAQQENLNFQYSDFGKNWNARDAGQARNVYHAWREFGMNQKVVWIAHTSHTSHMRSDSDWWKTGMGAFRSAVSIFENLYAQPVYNIMLTSYEVTGAQADWAVPTSTESMDLKLHNRGENYVAWNPRSSYVKTQPRWWVHNENYDDPSTYRDGVYMIPEDNFDYFLFVDQTFRGVKIEPWVSPFTW